MARIPEEALEKWRRTPCEQVLDGLGLYWKRDASYRAKKRGTMSVHVEGARFKGELVLTGPKFWCPREKKGGCGAIDLAMFVEGLPFLRAAARLGGAP